MKLKTLVALLSFLLCVAFVPRIASAQETEPPDGTRISAANVSGIDIDRLSPGLRGEISRLAGTSLNRQVLRDLAARLEGEQPRYITAIRVTPDKDTTARVTFLVARITTEQRETNINDKYSVDRVDVHGVPERDLGDALRKELDSLVGKPLDTDAAEEIAAKLRSAFPGYEVGRRVARSEKKGTLRVIYTLTKPEWMRYLRFEPMRGSVLYHSDQGWGTVLPLAMSGGDFHVMPVVTWSDADNFLEENSGFGIRVESRRLGNERLGMLLDWSTLDANWRPSTQAALAADPRLPAAYRNRMSFTPLLKFAFTPQVSVAGGVGITEMDPLDDVPGLPSQMANVAIGSLRYAQRWSPSSRVEHHAGATLTLRKGTSSLESDFEYDHVVGDAGYYFRNGKHHISFSGTVGRISGDAPLFERFTLGDSHTLRGWDKYDIAPAGGDRMFHTSLEYRYRGLMLFVDGGSVWNRGDEKKIRFSTGAGFASGPAFFTIGFPVNTDEFRAVLTMGFRFGIAVTGVRKD